MSKHDLMVIYVIKFIYQTAGICVNEQTRQATHLVCCLITLNDLYLHSAFYTVFVINRKMEGNVVMVASILADLS